MRNALPLLLASSLLLQSLPAQAQPAPAPSASTASPAAGSSAWLHDGSWGWFVVASSVFVGAGFTGFGLGIDCAEGDRTCARWTAMSLWGGIGTASLGSILGLVIVGNGQARARPPVLSLGPLGEFQLFGPAPAHTRFE